MAVLWLALSQEAPITISHAARLARLIVILQTVAD